MGFAITVVSSSITVLSYFTKITQNVKYVVFAVISRNVDDVASI